ncbi:MAG: TRAP transporter small permease subunit [Lachnospiraceae bacterium]|nr:TRAP transporter small permease subunit [Lachnospiraceae bacterium]
MKKIDFILDKIFHYLTALSFGLVSVCVLAQIVARYIPSISAPWTDEMTRLFFMYTIMFGSPMAIKYSEYAVIDIITSRFKGKTASVINVLVYLITCILCVVGFRQSYTLFQTGFKLKSSSLQISMIYFYIVPVCIFGFTFIYSARKIIEEIITVIKGGK